MSPRDRFWNPHQIKVDDKEVNPPINTTERTNVFGTLYTKSRSDPTIDREYGSPSGGAPGFVDTQPFPNNIPGVLGWIDASVQAGFNDNDTVNTATNVIKGYGNFLGVCTFKTNIQNGKPIFRFNGTTSNLIFTHTDQPLQEFTWIVVGCYRLLNTNDALLVYPGRQHLKLNGSNQISMTSQGLVGPTIVVNQFFTAIVTSPKLIPPTTLFVDNVKFTTNALVSNAPFTVYCVGSDTSAFAQVDICEAGLVGRIMTDIEALDIGGRLRTKWGTP